MPDLPSTFYDPRPSVRVESDGTSTTTVMPDLPVDDVPPEMLDQDGDLKPGARLRIENQITCRYVPPAKLLYTEPNGCAVYSVTERCEFGPRSTTLILSKPDREILISIELPPVPLPHEGPIIETSKRRVRVCPGGKVTDLTSGSGVTKPVPLPGAPPMKPGQPYDWEPPPVLLSDDTMVSTPEPLGEERKLDVFWTRVWVLQPPVIRDGCVIRAVYKLAMYTEVRTRPDGRIVKGYPTLDIITDTTQGASSRVITWTIPGCVEERAGKTEQRKSGSKH